MAVRPRFPKRAFAIQLFLQPSQGFLHRLTFFQFDFRQLVSHPSLMPFAIKNLRRPIISVLSRTVKGYRGRPLVS